MSDRTLNPVGPACPRRWRAAALVLAGVVAVPVSVGLGLAPASAAGTTAAPTITALSPTSGAVGSTLVIEGTGLVTGDAVTIGSSTSDTATTAATDGDSLTLTVPSDATTGSVVVTQSGTTVTGPTYTVVASSTAQLTATHHTITTPHSVTLSSQLVGGSGRTATLQSQAPSSTTWSSVREAQTQTASSSGRVSWTITPTSTRTYRAVFAASGSNDAVTTSSVTVRDRPLLSLSAPATAVTGNKITLRGTVRPHLSGPVVLERKAGHTWTEVRSVSTHSGHFTTTVTAGSAGTVSYRVTRAADSDHLAATSTTETISVVAQTLSYGDHGSAVLALQKRLRALHYDIGAVNGSFGWDTEHAVTVFQKVQGLSPTGIATGAVLSDLAHPKRPTLRYTSSSVAVDVEVNLAHQWLIIAKHGKIWRILDTSTAGGYLYTDSSGQTERAVTPTGNFTIKYKVDHLVHAKLGTLFRPSFFNYSGYAIHGEGDTNAAGDVPPYANSHGCVRITDSAVDRYYSLFAVGMPVHIYR